jgi:hypothetical protein
MSFDPPKGRISRSGRIALLSTALVALASIVFVASGLSANNASRAALGAVGARSQATVISPEFITKANRLCAKLNVRFGHALGKFPFQNFDAIHPDLKTLPLVGKHFANALPIRRAIPAELRGLGEPTTGRRAWDAIRSLALQGNAAGIKQVSAALASNAKGFVATVNQIHRLHNATGAKATAAGFPKASACGQTF